MSGFIRRRSTPSLVVAVIAVVLALGGTALATSSGGRGSSSRTVAAKKHRLTRHQMRRFVRRFVKHHPGPRGRRGPVGLTGPAGSAGPKGATGATGAKGAKGAPGDPAQNGLPYEYEVFSDPTTLSADSNDGADAFCDGGDVATGGGFVIGDADPDTGELTPDQNIQVLQSSSDFEGWFAYAQNYGDGMGDNANAFIISVAECTADVGDEFPVKHKAHKRVEFSWEQHRK